MRGTQHADSLQTDHGVVEMPDLDSFEETIGQ
jgi:hypothetical protein